jgi:hypothetical protein
VRGVARATAAGAEVDDPVGVLDDVEIVLDHEDGVAGVDEAVQRSQEGLGIGLAFDHCRRRRGRSPPRYRRECSAVSRSFQRENSSGVKLLDDFSGNRLVETIRYRAGRSDTLRRR